MTEKNSTSDIIDHLNKNVSGLCAMLDTAMVASAGEGGYQLCDASMPELLHFARELASSIGEDANKLYDLSHRGLTPRPQFADMYGAI